ncbi:unnamed protein product, partial [Mesorhabditis spiculigera]
MLAGKGIRRAVSQGRQFVRNAVTGGYGQTPLDTKIPSKSAMSKYATVAGVGAAGVAAYAYFRPTDRSRPNATSGPMVMQPNSGSVHRAHQTLGVDRAATE